LMLILDVKTCWSSMHQMLNRAYVYRQAIQSFVLLHEDLHPLKLDFDDWKLIQCIIMWLCDFCQATTFMSLTKDSALSSAFGCFIELQDKLRQFLQTLLPDTPTSLKLGLKNAHGVLAEYLYKFTTSLYYLWAALLDPRISYSRLREDAGSDTILLDLIESARAGLEEHYKQTDKLLEYFNMKQERSWDAGKPVKWWSACCAQFPWLSSFTHDIHCIPGSAVVVERIFSGGCDTIALHQASLQPETISSLMLVKQWLKSK
ncbi:uncharacterized protein FOMMEDRAFT_75886, partial [Fomitiporia mediterranea MF3/22]|uniref:uncharacterized protein n=1 Tax=Fomitiporia mediterranea (strain MF3/22) TaxID=694068 RepID=UPI0004408AC4